MREGDQQGEEETSALGETIYLQVASVGGSSLAPALMPKIFTSHGTVLQDPSLQNNRERTWLGLLSTSPDRDEVGLPLRTF